VAGPRRVAVLGAGIMGTCAALYLARRGCQVVLFDEAPAPFSGASRWNEGKIHLGYLYSAASSLETARLLVPGGLAFKPLIEELIGESLASATTGEDDIYLIHRDSVASPAAVAAHYETLTEMIREHPDASNYLVDARASRVSRLESSELNRLADRATIVDGFRVLERSVSTEWVADRLVGALAAEPRITLAMGQRIVKVVSDAPAGEGPWRVQALQLDHGPFDAVVNALWHGRPAIDRSVGDCVDRVAHHRYRVALFVRSSRPLAVPSMLIAVGPYGDIKNYNGRDFYVSWYPVGMLVSGQQIDHPATPVLDIAGREAIASAVFDAIGAILPGVREIREAASDVAVEGGWVYAQATGTLDDPRSTLHRRDHLGVKWFGTYASVDTGKYSVAPYLARALAERIAS